MAETRHFCGMLMQQVDKSGEIAIVCWRCLKSHCPHCRVLRILLGFLAGDYIKTHCDRPIARVLEAAKI